MRSQPPTRSSPPAYRLLLAALLVLACAVMAPGSSRAATVKLDDTDNLQAKIDAATGGDVLLLGNGPYQGFKISDRHFTAERPLVIKAATGAHPVIRGTGYQGYLAKISRSSYLVLDGLTMEHVNQPIYCLTVDHVVLVNLDIHDTGQEAIHLRGDSRHVDVRHCRIHDTGHSRPQWSEGVYVGTGQPPYENAEHVWIEGNDISRTGNSEAINLKARTYHATIRGNRIHDIAPGTATQHNEAAISCEAADRSFKPGVDPDIWIEDNEVFDVRYGRWANGIKVSTMGGRILRNEIHDCAQTGITFNAYDNGPGVFTAWLFGNHVTRCQGGTIGETVLPRELTDPGPNPNRPQTWY